MSINRLFGVMLGVILLVCLAARYSSGQAHSHSSEVITCSPAPCILPTVEISTGPNLVNTPPIVANPANSKNLLVGANDYNCPEFSGPLAAYTSNDGGSTWSRATCMVGVQNYSPTIFPTVGYDRSGRAYLAGTYEDNEGGGTGFIGVENSDNGFNWSDPVPVLDRRNGYSDTSWLVVDTSPTSPYVNRVYLSADVVGGTEQIMVAHSSDGGNNWKTVNAEPPQGGQASDAFTTMTVGEDGSVYLTWQHCAASGPSAHCQNGKASMLFSKSIDGGDTWTAPKVIATVTLNNDACHCYFGDLPNTVVRVANYPVIAIDNSTGPHAGSLYVTMYTWTGTYMRVGIVRSTDGGNTWSRPTWVAPPNVNHDQFFAWVSVSNTGLLGLSWLDRRNDPANLNYQPFAAISSDGGRSFHGPNVQLTAAFSNPTVNGYPGNSWMGDYTGNTWDGSNFVVAWMDSSNGINMQEVVGGIRVK